jgi:hypothetical protein
LAPVAARGLGEDCELHIGFFFAPRGRGSLSKRRLEAHAIRGRHCPLQEGLFGRLKCRPVRLPQPEHRGGRRREVSGGQPRQRWRRRRRRQGLAFRQESERRVLLVEERREVAAKRNAG